MRGIDIFKSYFKDYADQYVLIGGAACDLIFAEQADSFRATKDLDLVLIVEALTPEFGRKFWAFIRDGGYENRVKSNGLPQFYRFQKPKAVDFPYMIELFSKTVDALIYEGASVCTPLPLGEEVSSLSAILLNEDYYNLLLNGRIIIADIVILSHLYLIPFKAKAWLDLSMRKSQGEKIDGKDIKKHKNDIMRLAVLLSGTEKCELPVSVKEDMSQFVAQLEREPIDLKVLGISGVKIDEVIEVLIQVYLAESTIKIMLLPSYLYGNACE